MTATQARHMFIAPLLHLDIAELKLHHARRRQ